MLKLVLILSLSIASSSCQTLQSVSLTQIPSARENKVSASVSRWHILGLNFNNDYVDGLVDALKTQCPKGKIQGILTKDEAVLYLGSLVHKRLVTASGYCLKS